MKAASEGQQIQVKIIRINSSMSYTTLGYPLQMPHPYADTILELYQKAPVKSVGDVMGNKWPRINIPDISLDMRVCDRTYYVRNPNLLRRIWRWIFEKLSLNNT